MLRTLLDLLFPPLCVHCEAPAPKSKLCNTCWDLSQVIDPAERCHHCFAPSAEPICSQCTKTHELPYPRAAVFEYDAPIFHIADEETASAMASFAYLQWQRLVTRLGGEPDFVISLIPSPIAKALAHLCQKPSPSLFRRRFLLHGEEKWELNQELIPEDALILLFDPGCTQKQLKWACSALSGAFPRRVLLLSLRIFSS